jgi:hypothetical protein
MTDPSSSVTAASDRPADVGPVEESAVAADPPKRSTRPARPPGQYQQAFWFGLLLATAVTLGSVSFVIGAYGSAAQPETVVRDYFAALQRGDAAGALGYGAVPDGPHGLLTPEVLAAQNRIGSITAVTVRAVRRSGDTASVDVDYTVGFATGPEVVADTVPVVRAGHGWRLARSAEPEDIEPADGAKLADIAGSAVPSGRFALFPGALPVIYTTPNLELDHTSNVVSFDDDRQLEVSAQVSALGRRTVGAAVDAALRTCLAGRATVEVSCPLPDADADVPGTLLGRQTGPLAGTTSAQLFLTVESPDGRIDIAASVPVEATYTALDDNNMPVHSTTTSVGLRAHCYATDPGAIVWDAP